MHRLFLPPTVLPFRRLTSKMSVGSGRLLGHFGGIVCGVEGRRLRHQARRIHNNSCELHLFTNELVDNHAPDCHAACLWPERLEKSIGGCRSK